MRARYVRAEIIPRQKRSDTRGRPRLRL